jgi:hypothetical protein
VILNKENLVDLVVVKFNVMDLVIYHLLETLEILVVKEQESVEEQEQ